MSKYLTIGFPLIVFMLQACTNTPNRETPPNGFSEHTVQSGGQERTYQLYRPASAQSGAAAVFVLHGSRGSGASMRSIAGEGFESLADKHGFIVVYPDGYENHWNDCRGSADYSANTENIDDVAFFSKLVDQISSQQDASKERMFVTGLSNGGQMAYKLALESPSLFKGYAAVIASLPEDRNLDCSKSNEPVSMMIMNGTKDPINPYEGGVVSVGENSSRGPVMSTRETALYWAGLAGNRRPPMVKQHPEQDGNPATSIEEKNWQKGNGSHIRLLTMHGSGHVLPALGKDIPAEYAAYVGRAAKDADGPELIIDFFLGLP